MAFNFQSVAYIESCPCSIHYSQDKHATYFPTCSRFSIHSFEGFFSKRTWPLLVRHPKNTNFSNFHYNENVTIQCTNSSSISGPTDSALDIEKFRQRFQIDDLLKDFLELKPSGDRYMANCPFHAENTPSFVIYPAQGTFHCFGCKEHGDGITFVMKHLNLSFRDAIIFIAKKYNFQDAVQKISLSFRKLSPEEKIRIEQERKKLDRMASLNFTAMEFYKAQLQTSPASHARKYLQMRNISQETIDRFAIGYAPAAWNRLRDHMKDMGFSDDELYECGLIKRGKSEDEPGLDQFRNRIMIPIRDSTGTVVGFGGRRLEDKKTENISAKYLNSSESLIFKKSENLFGTYERNRNTNDPVVLVEGYFDVIALHQAGIETAIAALGTGITEKQFGNACKIAHNNTLVINLDGDEAGVNATCRICDILHPKFRHLPVTTKVASYPAPMKDASDYLDSHSKEDYVSEVLKTAVPIIAWRCNMLIGEWEKRADSSIESAVYVVNEIGKYLSEVLPTESLARKASVLLYGKKYGAVIAEKLGLADDGSFSKILIDYLDETKSETKNTEKETPTQTVAERKPDSKSWNMPRKQRSVGPTAIEFMGLFQENRFNSQFGIEKQKFQKMKVPLDNGQIREVYLPEMSHRQVVELAPKIYENLTEVFRKNEIDPADLQRSHDNHKLRKNSYNKKRTLAEDEFLQIMIFFPQYRKYGTRIIKELSYEFSTNAKTWLLLLLSSNSIQDALNSTWLSEFQEKLMIAPAGETRDKALQFISEIEYLFQTPKQNVKPWHCINIAATNMLISEEFRNLMKLTKYWTTINDEVVDLMEMLIEGKIVHDTVYTLYDVELVWQYVFFCNMNEKEVDSLLSIYEEDQKETTTAMRRQKSVILLLEKRRLDLEEDMMKKEAKVDPSVAFWEKAQALNSVPDLADFDFDFDSDTE